jgi:hypothetical protein
MSTDKDFGTVMTPDIPLNGTSGSALAEMYDLAAQRLHDVLTALCEASPNARDYTGSNGFPLAQKQHEERAGKLREVLADLMVIRESIADQNDARAARRGRS